MEKNSKTNKVQGPGNQIFDFNMFLKSQKLHLGYCHGNPLSYIRSKNILWLQFKAGEQNMEPN